MKFLRQSTASQTRTIGPFVDDTDGKTAETALTIANTDVKLMVNGGASANKNSGGGTHRANGHYAVTFDATDTATVGELTISVVVAGALPVWAQFFVLEEAVYDAIFAASAAGPLTTLGTNAPSGWINAAALASNAITSAKIAADAIGAGQIASGAITSAKFASGAITSTVLATGAIISTTFAADSITANACAADFIGAAEIAASASQEIADLIAADWVAGDASPLAIAAAVSARLAADAVGGEDNWMAALNMIANQVSLKISFDITTDSVSGGNENGWLEAKGELANVISAQIASDIPAEDNGWETAVPILQQANLKKIDDSVDFVPALNTALEEGFSIHTDSASNIADQVWYRNTSAFAASPGSFGYLVQNIEGGGGGGGDATEANQTAILDAIAALNDFDPATDQVIVATNNDKTNYQLSAATMSTLFDDADAATQLAAFFTGLNERFDNAADIPPSIIAQAVWTYASGRSLTVNPGLDATAIRTALGLGSANLDTQFASLVTATAAAALRSALGLTANNLDNQLTAIQDAIDGGLSDEVIDAVSSGVAAAMAGIQLSVQTQIALSGSIDLKVIQGDDYTASPTRIDLDTSMMTDPEVDLSSKKFVIAAKKGQTIFALRMSIQGSAGSHYVEFGPPSSMTEDWATGTYDMLYRIEWDTDKYQTIAEGTLTIDPFDIEPGDIVDI